MHKIINATKTALLALVLSFGLSYVYAWTAPTSNPPMGNVSAPINTSATLQQKSGDFTVKNFVADMVNVGLPLNANAITAPKFCIGASCITAWTQAGQPKVTGSCAVGQAITAINADGTVMCGVASGGTGLSGIYKPLANKTISCTDTTSMPGTTWVFSAKVDANGYNFSRITVAGTYNHDSGWVPGFILGINPGNGYSPVITNITSFPSLIGTVSSGGWGGEVPCTANWPMI